MIKIFQLSFLLFANFSFGQLSQTPGLLWEINRDDLPAPSYLYGSFHTNDRRVFDWMDSTYIALENCETISLEVDIFEAFHLYEPTNSDLRLKFDRDGNLYSNNETASRSHYGDEDGMPQFLDATFQQYCYNTGKELFPLESLEDQLEVIEQEPTTYWLSDFSSSYFQEKKEKFLSKYLESDVSKLDQFLRSSMGEKSKLYQSLIVERNKLMFDGLDTIMPKRKGVFCAVGAGHLGGRQGILSLLKNKGYSVRKINVGSNVNRKNLISDFRKLNTYEFTNDSLGLFANFYGKPIEIVQGDFLIGYEYVELGQGNQFKIEVYPLENEITLVECAENFINLPEDAKTKIIELPNGKKAIEGISENYFEGITWKRILIGEKYLFVLVAKGGNKFMNSQRSQRFFNQVLVK